MYKPNYEIEGPKESLITLRACDLALYLLAAFLAGAGAVGLYCGF